MHPPPIWEESGGASYSLNVAYQACWGWGRGGKVGSQEAGAGSPLQEADSSRSGVMLRALGSRGCPGGAKQGRQESPLQHTIVLGRRV